MSFESPRDRRLRSDQEAMACLAAESTILAFKASGDPPDYYVVTFNGQSLLRDGATGQVRIGGAQRCEIRLGVMYPRGQPDLTWLTPIFHPNISESGQVCIGGYGTNWVPSLGLDELCGMLWDMVRFENFDPKSPYNHSAGKWSESQRQFRFPLDARPLRDMVAKDRGVIPIVPVQAPARPTPKPAPPKTGPADRGGQSEIRIPKSEIAVPPSGVGGAAGAGSAIPRSENPQSAIRNPQSEDIVFLDEAPAPPPKREEGTGGVIYIGFD